MLTMLIGAQTPLTAAKHSDKRRTEKHHKKPHSKKCKNSCDVLKVCNQCCPATKVEDTSLLFAGIAQCNLKSQIRLQKGSFYPPIKYQFDKSIYPPFLEFQGPPPDFTTFSPSPAITSSPFFTPLANFMQDKLIEYYTAKGTLEIYKDPTGTSVFTFHGGGATSAETAIHNAFSLEGTGTPDGKKNYIILQALPNYNGPANFGASLDTPNVWNLMYRKGSAASTVAQINDAVARLKSGLAPRMTTDPSEAIWVDPATFAVPRSAPEKNGDWEIIEWLISPGNPLGNLPEIDHHLDNPVGAVGWHPRKIFVLDAAFSTPAYQPVNEQDCIDHALNICREVRANPEYELITFGSISKQFGLVSIRAHYAWFPEKLWSNHPNWMQWYENSIVSGNSIEYHSIEYLLNTMQEELDGDLGVEDDSTFNSVNIQIQQTLVNEFQAKYPGQVTLLSLIGGPVLYLEFDQSVYAPVDTMVNFLADNFGIILNNSIQYNTPNVLLDGQTLGAGQCRFATCNGTDDYVAVLNRIVGFNKYKPSDFLPPNGKSCKIVKSVKKQKLNYTVSLDDQVLLVDASCAPVKIELPSFQSFACVPRHLQIKNISKCHKKVRVSTSNVVPSAPLDFVLESGKVVVLQWQALASLDEGKWVILK